MPRETEGRKDRERERFFTQTDTQGDVAADLKEPHDVDVLVAIETRVDSAEYGSSVLLESMDCYETHAIHYIHNPTACVCVVSVSVCGECECEKIK